MTWQPTKQQLEDAARAGGKQLFTQGQFGGDREWLQWSVRRCGELIMCNCTELIYPAGYTDHMSGEWIQPEPVAYSKTVDISVGSYKCLIRGEVGYYTGHWAKTLSNPAVAKKYEASWAAKHAMKGGA